MATLQEKIEEVIEKLSKKVPLELSADDGLQDINWNSTVASIKLLTEALSLIKNTPSSLPYKGAPYFRMPGMQKPWEALPFTLENEWTVIHELYEGDFMRLAGGNASDFKEDSTSISYDTDTKGDGGGQRDSFEQHSHGYTRTTIQGPGYYGKGMDWQGSNNHWSYVDSSSGKRTGDANGRTTSETRSKNVTIELYIYKGKDI